MRGAFICAIVIMMLLPVQGEEEEQLEHLMESVGSEEEEEEHLQCFRCDLGFWDACYTTETNCTRGELCYTGRGKAADTLDVKTLGCVKADECGVKTVVELFLNETLFIMTKHCCDTPFCNAAHQLPIHPILQLTAYLTFCHLALT